MEFIQDGSIDFIWANLAIMLARWSYVDYLPPLDRAFNGKAALFVSNDDKLDIIEWAIFLGPLSDELWILVLFSAFIFSLFICAIEWFYLENKPVSCMCQLFYQFLRSYFLPILGENFIL